METQPLEVFRTVALVPPLAIRGTPADIALLRAVYVATPAGRTRPATVDRFLTHLAEQAARR